VNALPARTDLHLPGARLRCRLGASHAARLRARGARLWGLSLALGRPRADRCGAAGYLFCAADFLAKGGGTPAIWFTRHLRFLLGEEPRAIVRQGLYRFSRNPMYLSVAAVVFGEAWLFGSVLLLLYAIAVSVCFQLVVVFLEEPHLRRKCGASYAEYCRKTPRWIR
jgi:protein-S-isoprenylcysteine O-methyltransferase Ste14